MFEYWVTLGGGYQFQPDMGIAVQLSFTSALQQCGQISVLVFYLIKKTPQDTNKSKTKNPNKTKKTQTETKPNK